MLPLAADENLDNDIIRGLLRRNPALDIVRTDFSDDNCTVTTNAVCMLDDGSEVGIMSTVMYAGRTEAEAVAEISIEATDGSSCRSRYDVWWRQL